VVGLSGTATELASGFLVVWLLPSSSAVAAAEIGRTLALCLPALDAEPLNTGLSVLSLSNVVAWDGESPPSPPLRDRLVTGGGLFVYTMTRQQGSY
jgi:hypothetical protein